MNPFRIVFLALVFTLPCGTYAHAAKLWAEISPDHGQTYAYGSVTAKSWHRVGSNQHLALYATFDNGPWAQGGGLRYDYFTFNFPHITLGSDGETFYYTTSSGRKVPVAKIVNGFLWTKDIKLLPNAYLIIRKKHGYLTVTLLISNEPFEREPGLKISFDH